MLPAKTIAPSTFADASVEKSGSGLTEGRLQLIVNRAKCRAVPLKQCAFLGYRIGYKGKLVWTEKVQHRFKERIREGT